MENKYKNAFFNLKKLTVCRTGKLYESIRKINEQPVKNLDSYINQILLDVRELGLEASLMMKGE